MKIPLGASNVSDERRKKRENRREAPRCLETALRAAINMVDNKVRLLIKILKDQTAEGRQARIWL